VVSEFQEIELPGDTYRPTHQWVEEVVILIEHRTIGGVSNEFQSVCKCFVSRLLCLYSSFQHLFVDFGVRNTA